MIFTRLLMLLPEKTAYAHCDIPCGIYDPTNAQIAAHSVLRMTNMLLETPRDDELKAEHQVTRLTKVKEEHAEIVKHEVRVIWGDYFKEENFKDLPGLHELVFEIMKLAGKTKQEIDRANAEKLLVKVQEFSEAFYKSKGRKTQRVKTVYPTEGELVYPV